MVSLSSTFFFLRQQTWRKCDVNDVLQFRDEPTEVFAVTANDGEKRFQNVEEMTSVVMRFPEERIATFTCSFGAADVSRFTLIGTKGSLTSDPAYEYAMEIKHELMIGDKKTTSVFPKRDQFAGELVYFSELPFAK